MNEQGNVPNNNGMEGVNTNIPTNQPLGNMPNITLGQVVNNEPVQANSMPQTVGQAVNEVTPPMAPPQPVSNPAPQSPIQQPSMPPAEAPQTIGQAQSMPTQASPTDANQGEEKPKKKPVALIAVLILVLLVAGAGALYYFVLDNPKTIFTTAANKALSKANVVQANVIAEDKNMKELLDVINHVKLEGMIGTQADTTLLSGVINYKDEKLLDYNLQVDSANNVLYAKFADLYENVIKVDLSSEEETDSTSNIDVDTSDYEQVLSSVKESIISTLETANYNKEVTKLDGKNVKKVTLTIDEAFLSNINNKLLSDDKFMTSYAKITGMTKDEITDEFKQTLEDYKGSNETISLYLSLLGNEFIKCEYVSDDGTLAVSVDGDAYKFSFSEASTTKYEGTFKVSDISDKKLVAVSLTSVEDKMTVNINATYNTVSNVELLDVSHAINYEELTEEEMSDIILKLADNKALTNLISDLGLDDMASMVLSSDI